jgi:hypothetical protein
VQQKGKRRETDKRNKDNQKSGEREGRRGGENLGDVNPQEQGRGRMTNSSKNALRKAEI